MNKIKIPIYVITGFLGSGKTTLLNHLVNHAEMIDTAVIINEFGEVGIDHLLVKSSFENAILLQNGCLCCTIRGDLLDTLETLAVRREHGDVPNFKRVVIETTGLADPAPILQTLMSDPIITSRYVLNSIVTTVDSSNAISQFRDHPEPIKQAAIADLLLLTKSDLVSSENISTLVKNLNHVNPTSEKRPISKGEIDPSEIFDRRDFNPNDKNIDVSQWFEKDNDHHHNHDKNRHSSEISTFCITRGTPLPWRAVKQWLQSILSVRGNDILRIKGVIDLQGFDKPVALHAIQHTLHDPVVIEQWPEDEPSSNIIVIGRNLNQADFEVALDKLLADQAA